MGIPDSIKPEHIRKAIEEIRRKGVPSRRQSTGYDLIDDDGRRYPPKYVVSIANRYANGVELDSNEFSGGVETNNFLKNKGFMIVDKD